tara:strand:+ start:68 stop:973 length:906 start_codon:yes stop_codon:yes gene_type:complete
MNKKLTTKLMAALVAVGMIAAGTITFADSDDNQGFWSNMMGGSVFSQSSSMMGSGSNTMMGNGFFNQGNNMMGYSSDGNNNGGYGHMGGMMGGYSSGGNTNNGFGGMGSMMGASGWGANQEFDQSEVKPLEDLKDNVMKYLEYFDGDFEIEDILVYSNSDYYFSIVEVDTGRGAMELLVNPVSGYVYPEFGPNMMWNTEYGMHGSNGYGMMGMMGGFFNNYDEDEQLSSEEAILKANDYLGKNDNNLNVEQEGHTFYGYYTFHVYEGENLVGMMSVNAYTGELWYHNWHGNLIEVISVGHE